MIDYTNRTWNAAAWPQGGCECEHCVYAVIEDIRVIAKDAWEAGYAFEIVDHPKLFDEWFDEYIQNLIHATID